MPGCEGVSWYSLSTSSTRSAHTTSYEKTLFPLVITYSKLNLISKCSEHSLSITFVQRTKDANCHRIWSWPYLSNLTRVFLYSSPEIRSQFQSLKFSYAKIALYHYGMVEMGNIPNIWAPKQISHRINKLSSIQTVIAINWWMIWNEKWEIWGW